MLFEYILDYVLERRGKGDPPGAKRNSVVAAIIMGYYGESNRWPLDVVERRECCLLLPLCHFYPWGV
jgi:hypothetical protein